MSSANFPCRAHDVRRSLPYLLPAPSLSGSFGAVIQLRSRVGSRAALLSRGAMGPICGLTLAIATSALSLSLPHCGLTTLIRNIQSPLIVGVLLGGLTIVPSSLPSSSRILFWSRTGWGILITAINLIPSGQLDGGHILCAISLKSHPFCTRIVVVVLFMLGLLFLVSCILWSSILLKPGMRHPSVASSEKLRGWRLALVPECGSILVLTFTFAPSRATARFR